MSMYRYSWSFISCPAPGGSVYDALLVHGLELDHLLVLLAQRLHTHARAQTQYHGSHTSTDQCSKKVNLENIAIRA